MQNGGFSETVYLKAKQKLCRKNRENYIFSIIRGIFKLNTVCQILSSTSNILLDALLIDLLVRKRSGLF